MKSTVMFVAAATLLISGCDTPVNQKLVSTNPATPQQFSEAKNAATVCGRHCTLIGSLLQTALKSGGYTETENARLKRLA